MSARIAHHIIDDSLDWSAAIGEQLLEILYKPSRMILVCSPLKNKRPIGAGLLPLTDHRHGTRRF